MGTQEWGRPTYVALMQYAGGRTVVVPEAGPRGEGDPYQPGTLSPPYLLMIFALLFLIISLYINFSRRLNSDFVFLL